MKNQKSWVKSISIFICFIVVIPSIHASNHLLSKNQTTKSDIISFSEDYLEDLLIQVNETRLYHHIETIQEYGPHPTGSASLDDVGEYIYSSFQSFNIQTVYDHWEVDGITGKNIVATIPGETQSQFILTAHYDTIDVSPGADDDGSGIASILMIAELLKSFEFHQTIKFIIFSGEEIGLLGSTHYAQNAYESDIDIIGVLSLDKIGYAATSDDGNKVRHHANPQSKWMVEISKDIISNYQSFIGLEVIGHSFDPSSDHRAFVNLGFYGSNLVEEALNPMYHTSEDTIEYINFSYLSKITKLTLVLTTKIASIQLKNADYDFDVFITGSYLSDPSCLSVEIKNNHYPMDRVNVSISIQLKHIFKDSYVQIIKEFYTEPCSWNFNKEIKESWRFDIGPRIFSQGFFRIDVIVSGLYDDFRLYEEEHTIGIIYSYYKFLILPKT